MFMLIYSTISYFEFDKQEITPKAATIIDEIAQIMHDRHKQKISHHRMY